VDGCVADRPAGAGGGEDARGYIAYTEDGHVFVAIMRQGRGPFAAGDLLSGSGAEKARAESFVAYCGRYEFRGESVVHHVELSACMSTSAAASRNDDQEHRRSCMHAW
jgi:hypothetical protein